MFVFVYVLYVTRIPNMSLCRTKQQEKFSHKAIEAGLDDLVII